MVRRARNVIRELRCALAALLFVPCGCIEYQLVPITDSEGGCPDAALKWDSGEDNSIATETYETPTGYGITGIKVYREPRGNADNFIARLDVECREWDDDYGVVHWGDSTQTTTVFNGEYNVDSGVWVRLDDDHWLTGVHLLTRDGDGYVKDITLYGHKVKYSDYAYDKDIAGPAFGLSFGDGHDLGCGDCEYISVVTGLKIEWDTRRGKIRRFDLVCSTFWYQKK